MLMFEMKDKNISNGKQPFVPESQDQNNSN